VEQFVFVEDADVKRVWAVVGHLDGGPVLKKSGNQFYIQLSQFHKGKFELVLFCFEYKVHFYKVEFYRKVGLNMIKYWLPFSCIKNNLILLLLTTSTLVISCSDHSILFSNNLYLNRDQLKTYLSFQTDDFHWKNSIKNFSTLQIYFERYFVWYCLEKDGFRLIQILSFFYLLTPKLTGMLTCNWRHNFFSFFLQTKWPEYSV
jgi:hypothetical protein